MSNFMKHAVHELDLIGLTEEDEYNAMMRKHILKMIEVFSDEGHSGFSASYAIHAITRLMRFKPLSALTGDDDEWVIHDYGDGTYAQNKRYSSVFKDKSGETYDINGKVFWEWAVSNDGEPYKSYYGCRESRVPVTFPYMPPDEPIYEYRQSDAEPRTPPQTEAGLL